MENLALITHVLTGFLSLAVGTIIMISKKGNRLHVQLGRIFFWSMQGVVLTAIYLSIVKDNAFLFHVGIFVFYQSFAGWRAVKTKSVPFKWYDSIIALIAALNGLMMILNGNIVLIVFGGISLFLVLGYLRSLYLVKQNKAMKRIEWLVQHISLKVGAYIGTLTAFLVVNIQLGEYNWIVWIAPTVLFVPLLNFWNFKYATKKKKHKQFKSLVSIILILGIIPETFAQPYVEGGNTRHRFAQLNLGKDLRYFLPNQTIEFMPNEAGQFNSQPINELLESRFIIGGTHFWGHADFYVAFSLNQWIKSNYRTGVETGARYFPWRIQRGRLAPFFGAAWMTNSYQANEGATQVRHDFPLSIGAVYAFGSHLIDISGNVSTNNTLDYYVNKNDRFHLMLPRFWVGIGYKYTLETTLSAEKSWQSGKSQEIAEQLSKQKKLNGLTIAIGPSTAMFLSDSEYNRISHPYLGQHKVSKVFIEYGLGYYWHPVDLQLNLAYRNIKSNQIAAGIRQAIKRQAITAEIVKFLGDYHGFAPFLGLGISSETLKHELNDDQQNLANQRSHSLEPGLVFGWDIRPNDLQLWYLRTNLRWFPLLEQQQNNGQYISFNQLEFNFIQLVLFPGRFL